MHTVRSPSRAWSHIVRMALYKDYDVWAVEAMQLDSDPIVAMYPNGQLEQRLRLTLMRPVMRPTSAIGNNVTIPFNFEVVAPREIVAGDFFTSSHFAAFLVEPTMPIAYATSTGVFSGHIKVSYGSARQHTGHASRYHVACVGIQSDNSLTVESKDSYIDPDMMVNAVCERLRYHLHSLYVGFNILRNSIED